MRTRMILFSMLLLGSAPGFAQEREDARGVVKDYDEPPRPVKITRPTYPKAAIKDGIEGTVTLELVIDRQGRVSKTRVLQSVPGLDDAALECVKAWTFKPAMRGGLPVEAVAQAPVTFKRSGKPEGRK